MNTINQFNVASIARTMMNEHGLSGWAFTFDRAKRRAGNCNHTWKKISLSYYYVSSDNSDEDIKDTILHEIAHALAGPGHGHDAYWKSICRRIGAKPKRCYGNDVVMPTGRYKAVCDSCKKEYYKHRRPKRLDSWFCRKCKSNCWPERGRLVWQLS
jgi:predicted SprT family Zn-dependent metalloprotease